MNEVAIAPRAKFDMAEALNFYNEQSNEVACQFLRALEEAIDLIRRDPAVWEKIDQRHHRYIMNRFPYSIIYRYHATSLTIVAVAHGSRDPNYWQQ